MNAPNVADETFTITITNDPARFVDPKKQRISARLSWFDRGTLPQLASRHRLSMF